MFSDIRLEGNRPLYLSISDYIKRMILRGLLTKDQKLPSTRALAKELDVSRNTIIQAYEILEDDGFVNIVSGQGAYIIGVKVPYKNNWKMDWDKKLNSFSKMANDLDIIKSEPSSSKDMISFKSIAPLESLFNLEDFKRAFLNRFSLEGEKILNYGYAQGYKPLIDYLLNYMENKGLDIEGKDILITNGFTEGFDICLASLTKAGDSIICENPTHNTAIKLMKLNNLNIIGINMEEDGIDTAMLEDRLRETRASFGFLIPSYHNPTGIVMSPEKRIKVFELFEKYEVPIIEDGFNEELRYSGPHLSPLITLAGRGNSVIYIGSLSKVLFPGLRIGWVLGDKKLISKLESVKRARNIHTSFLDQAILYEYLREGNLEKYLKSTRKIYGEKYDHALKLAKKHIAHKKIYGEGGLHIFIELEDGIRAREVLKRAMARDVIFMPGDIFYTDGRGENTFRLGFARSSLEEIEKGFKIIGQVIDEIK